MPGLRGKPAVMIDDIGIRGRLVIVRARDHARRSPGPGRICSMSSAFALRNALDDVHQDDVGEFLIGNAQRAIRADVAGAHNGDFLSHEFLILILGVDWGKTNLRL